MNDSNEADHMNLFWCSLSQDTVECTTLTAGVNSFWFCPLVERTGKSEIKPFQIAHAELLGGNLTMVLHVKRKPTAAGICC